MPAERYASVVDVHVILRRGGKVLLLRRAGDVYASGQLCLPMLGLAASDDGVRADARPPGHQHHVAQEPGPAPR